VFCDKKLICLEYVAVRQKLTKENALFEKFFDVNVKWSHVRIAGFAAFLRLQRHLLNNLVDQLPILNAHLLAPI